MALCRVDALLSVVVEIFVVVVVGMMSRLLDLMMMMSMRMRYVVLELVVCFEFSFVLVVLLMCFVVVDGFK